MSTYACAMDVSLVIEDEHKLLSALRNGLGEEMAIDTESEYDWPDDYHELIYRLRRVLPVETLISIEEDGGVNIYHNDIYIPDQWALFGPYFYGYIEWHSEEGNIWRDVFNNGVMTTYYPKITWPEGALDFEHPIVYYC